MSHTHGMMTRIIWDIIVIVGRHQMVFFEDRVTQNPLVLPCDTTRPKEAAPIRIAPQMTWLSRCGEVSLTAT